MDSKAHTASEGEVWDSCRMFCIKKWNKLGNYKNDENNNGEKI